jgi:hypothetical protein
MGENRIGMETSAECFFSARGMLVFAEKAGLSLLGSVRLEFRFRRRKA